MNRSLTLALAAGLLLLTGCTSSTEAPAQTERETIDMTPDQALDSLRQAATELLDAVARGEKTSEVNTRVAIPCGGPGGSEYLKIQYPYEAAFLPATTETLFDDARAHLEGAGLQVEGVQRSPVGEGLVFRGEGFKAKLLIHLDGAVIVRGQTSCLDNPDD